MFCTFTSALSIVCVQCLITAFFCGSLISCFPGIIIIISSSSSIAGGVKIGNGGDINTRRMKFFAVFLKTRSEHLKQTAVRSRKWQRNS